MKNKTTLIGFSILILSTIISIIYFTNNNATIDVPRFFVANAGDGTVSVIDLRESDSASSIQVNGGQISHGIAQSPNKNILYVGTGFEDKKLLAINIETEEVVKELMFDEGVHGIDIHPSGKYLYISLNPGLGNEEGGKLAVVDTESFEIEAFIETDPGPAHVSVSVDGSQVWVANVNANTVSAIDAFTYQVLASIPVGEIPNEVALSPLLDYAYVANVRSNSISVIDMVSFEVVDEIEAGEGVHGVTVTPDGEQIWTANNHSNDVSVIDKDTRSVKETIETGSYANHISFSPNGNWAFVTHRESNDLAVIDRHAFEVVKTVPLGSEPHEMTLKELVTFESTLDTNENWATALNKRYSIKKNEHVDGIDFDVELLSPYNEDHIYLFNNVSDLNLFDYFVVRLNLTTHSGDLNALNWTEMTKLMNNSGLEQPLSHWIVESGDSHHPRYLAVFEKVVGHSPLLKDETENLHLKLSPFLQHNQFIIPLIN